MAKVTNVGLHLVESSAAISDTGGEGQIWVKDDTPSSLYYTDDAGTDFRMGGITLKTKVDSTSGTAIDFTGIPSGVKRIIFCMNDVSTNSNSDYRVQLGDSGGFETSGYLDSAQTGTTAELSTAAFQLTTSIGSGETWSGQLTLCLLDSATNHWSGSHCFGRGDSGSTTVGAGSKALSGTLTQLRLTTVSGDTFDAGDVNISFS